MASGRGADLNRQRASGGIEPESVGSVRSVLGEGPAWDATEGRLVWVDIDEGLVHSWTPRTGAQVKYDVGRPVSAAIPCDTGGLALARNGGVFLFDEGAGTLTRIAPIEGRAIRTNDAKCDPRGRLWVGTMAVDGRKGAGTLFRVEPALGIATPFLERVSISNGLGWSPDGSRFYFVDTPLRRIDVFDYDLEAGVPSGRRQFARLADDKLPDGLCVDEEGGIWVALWQGRAVHRYSATGTLDEVLPMPVPHVTSCCFGGDRLDELYITTAAYGSTGAGSELAGLLFRARPGVRGLPTARWQPSAPSA